MEHFAIGTVSFVLALAFPLLYYISYKIRRLDSWSKCADAPKDRVGFFLAVAAIFGFALGSFAQPQWDKASVCMASGQPLVGTCPFLSSKV